METSLRCCRIEAFGGTLPNRIQHPVDKKAGLQPGAMVDHYKIIRPLGAGGMAEVYLARDTTLGRKVALKVIHPLRLGKKEFVERFLFEAKATARFNHPNIVHIYSVGQTEKGPYLALEYLEGQTLRDRLDHERLSVKESIRIGKAIVGALLAAHQNNLLHRDLKPENIVLGRDGRLRVLDFGLSCLLGTKEQVDLDEIDDPQLDDLFVSKNKGLRGTPHYMAPEQWKASEIGPAADIWALGLILYEMLVGCHPYHDVRNVQLLASVVPSPEPVPIPPSKGHLTFDLLTLLGNCLAKDAGERLTAQEVEQELDRQLNRDRQHELGDMNPFRGLSTFEEEHSPLFFGRGAEVASFVERLRHVPILPVIGPSGAGKSSFVKAGVVPRLREKGPLILVHLRPGRDPFLSLASSLVAAWKQPRISTGSLGPMGSLFGLQQTTETADESIGEPKQLSKRLAKNPLQLGLLLHRLVEQHRSYVVLFVDQLEELCAIESTEETNHQQSEDSGPEQKGGVLNRFMQAIACAADDPLIPVRVILTMREEFLTRLMTSNQVRHALNRIMVLRKPSQKTLVDILERTVKAVGYKFEEFHLAYELVDDVKEAQTRLPLIQFACQVMWQSRDEHRRVLTRKSYQEMGGVTGALVQHAEGVIKSLTSAEVNLSKRILLRLVTEDKTRRILIQQELLIGLPSEAEGVLERLVESRLVTISRNTAGGSVYAEEEGHHAPGGTAKYAKGAASREGECEIVHEALITQWERLNLWIEESREELALLNQIRQAAELWHKRGMRADDLWGKQALKEADGVVEQAISQGTLYLDFIQSSERQIRKGRIRLMSVVGAMVVVVLGSVWITNYLLKGKLCTGANEKIATVWNPQVKESVTKAFTGTGVSYVKDTLERVHRLVDTYTSDWAKHYTQACEATHVKGEQSDEVLDLRMGCLRKRLGEVKALLSVFWKADARVVQQAVQAIASLSGIDTCADERTLRAPYPPPKTEAARVQVAAIREKLVQVEALYKTGKYREGLDVANKLSKLANQVQYEPVQAQLLFQLGELFERTGEYQQAETALQEASRAAGESGDSLLAAHAMAKLVWIVGHRQARHDEAMVFAQNAEVVLGLGGRDNGVQAFLYTSLGALFHMKAQYDKALDYYSKALAISEKVLGPKHPLVAHSMNNLGVVHWNKGNFENALMYHHKSLSIRMTTLGSKHPLVAASLQNLGLVYFDKKNYNKSLEYCLKALEIMENTLSPEHPMIAWPLSGIGRALLYLGKPTQAIKPLERTISICHKKTCEPDSHGMGLFHLSQALVAIQGDTQRALGLANQARDLFGRNPERFQTELVEVHLWLKKLAVDTSSS